MALERWLADCCPSNWQQKWASLSAAVESSCPCDWLLKVLLITLRKTLENVSKFFNIHHQTRLSISVLQPTNSQVIILRTQWLHRLRMFTFDICQMAHTHCAICWSLCQIPIWGKRKGSAVESAVLNCALSVTNYMDLQQTRLGYVMAEPGPWSRRCCH